MRGEIRVWHWLGAIVIAVCAQVGVLAAVFSSEPVKDKPRQAGIVLQLTAVAMPGDSLAKSDEPAAALPVTKAPPSQPTSKPAPREVAKVIPRPKPKPKAKTKPKPKPKPKQAFKFEPKPTAVAVQTISVPRSVEPSTSSTVWQRKESTTKPEPVPNATTKTNTTEPNTAKSTPGSVGTRSATGPLAAALPNTQSSQTKAIYEGQLLTWIAQHKRYPRLARRQGLEGVVEVMFKLDPEGRVQTSSVSASSGYAVLDQAVMQLLEQASPMPTPPDFFDAESRTFRVPIAFSLR